MINQNNFGPMGADYDVSRKGYPDEVFEYIKSFIKNNNQITLDIGCGTGISTRQLKKRHFEVTGADKDETMIKIAIQHNSTIPYFVAATEALPFKSEQFDIVTAFNSFHWFNNDKSLTEIKRVLKIGGIFFAILKVSSENNNGYCSIYKKYAGDYFDSTKNHFKREFLIKSGFSNIEEKVFDFDEKYTVNDALTLVKSLSLWNIVPENKKPEMLKELKDFYETESVDEFIVMHRKISIITTFKV
ncbi:MAG: class I SAM-dependent methyltransferase [Patescibacteria group bacterium]|nr:class I SAM-dependent methyltransferase [Patescibacteria group bacterium]MDD4304042.1 class I SAM-dependent methyltransferase [Patescibacteria group bacterium]MDD4694919.1 class I SAM-dependent methyltransferase [Patescibacteria group bacterium]